MLRDKSPEEQNLGSEAGLQESSIAGAMFKNGYIARVAGEVFSPVDEFVEGFDIRQIYKDEGSAYQRMVVGLAGYCYDDKESHRTDKISDVVKPHFLGVYSDELTKVEVDYIVSNVNYLISTVGLIDNATKMLDVRGGAQNMSKDSMFNLMKVMARHDEKSASPEDRGAVSSLAYQSTRRDGGMVDFMLDEIGEGEYDSHIAIELITDSLRAGEVKSRQTIQQAVIKRHVTYTAKLLGVEEIDDKFLEKITDPELMEYWPGEVKQAVINRKGEITSNIENNRDICVKKLEARGLILNKRDKRSIENQVEIYFKELNKREVASKGVASVLKRRHRAKSEETKEEVVEIEKPKMKLIPNKILGPEKDGEETKLDFEDFRELARDYCKNNDANFDKDLEAIFKYLRHVDPKQDVIPGIWKLRGDKKAHFNGKILDILEYKPTMDNGVPTSTKLTKAMRIYMVRDGNKFGILKFGGKDKQQQDIKALTRGSQIGRD